MSWFIVYKGKAFRDSLTENLQKAGITFFMPIQKVEILKGEKMVIKEEAVLRNLIFIKTDRNVYQIANTIDGLRAPYLNRATHEPAIVSDAEMNQFMNILAYKSANAELLQDPYRHFTVGQRVRVRDGEFKGMEGYVLRMRGDRKLVIALGEMAIAVSGIHHTLFEPIK